MKRGKFDMEALRSGMRTIMVGCSLVLGVTQLGWTSPPTDEPAQDIAPAQEGNQRDDESAELGVIVAPTPGAGVSVSSVIWGSPADEAGIRTGDYILSVDDQPVSSLEELREVIQGKKAGSKVRIVVWRRGKKSTKEIVLASRAAESPVDRKAWLGVLLEPSDGVGARIRRVYPGSPAARGGLRRGDVVVAMKGQDVESVEQMIEQIEDLESDTEVELAVRRDDEERKVTVTLGAVRAAPWGWLREAFRPPLDEFQWRWSPGVPELVMPQDGYRRLEQRIEELQREVKRLRKEVQGLRKGETDQPDADPDESASGTHDNPVARARDYRQYFGWYGPYYTYPVPRRFVYRYRAPDYRPGPSVRYYYYYHSGRPYYVRSPYLYGPRFGIRVGPYWMDWY